MSRFASLLVLVGAVHGLAASPKEPQAVIYGRASLGQAAAPAEQAPSAVPPARCPAGFVDEARACVSTSPEHQALRAACRSGQAASCDAHARAVLSALAPEQARYEAMAFPEGPVTPKALQTFLKAKIEAQRRLEAAYRALAQLGSAPWPLMVSEVHIGMLSLHLADATEALDAPAALSEEQRQVFRRQLVKEARPLAVKAQEAFLRATQHARAGGFDDAHSRLATLRLKQLQQRLSTASSD